MNLKQWQKWTDWPLMILAIVFLAAFSWQVLAGTYTTLCEGLMNAIWIVFIVDYVVSLWLAEDKWQWFTHNLISTALWWAFVTATTVGYGDHTPVTVYGKMVAVGLMFTGIALIGMITAMLASWIVDQVNAEAEEREEEAQSETDRLRRDIRELTDTVAALREEIRGLRSPDASSSVPKPPSTPPIPSGL